MNVQLATKPETNLPQQMPERQQVSAMASTAGTSLAQRLVPAVENSQAWLAAGAAFLLTGLIIACSNWSGSHWGYLLMLIGLALPPVPALVHNALGRQAKKARAAASWERDVMQTKTVRRRFVYELNSRDYSRAI